MLPASDLAEIISSLAALNLDSNTTAAVLGAVLAPLLRSSESGAPDPEIRKQRADGRRNNGRRRRKYVRRARAGNADEHREALNARARERYAARKAKAAGNGRRSRSTPPAPDAAQSAPESRHDVTPERLWEHAAKLAPAAPWRAVAREFGLSDTQAMTAQRDGTLPGTPRAAARFLTLTA